MPELDWDAIPAAFRVHCWLEVEAPSARSHKNISFQFDEGLTGCWETTLMPTDDFGPAHVIYFPSHIEVHRYWTADSGCPEFVARIEWDDPDQFNKVLNAATGDLLQDWT